MTLFISSALRQAACHLQEPCHLQHVSSRRACSIYGQAWQTPLTPSCGCMQGLENMLWSFATLGRAPSERVLAAGAARLSDTMRDFNQQNLALTLWAFAKLGFSPPTHILHAAAAQAVILAPVRDCCMGLDSHAICAYACLATAVPCMCPVARCGPYRLSAQLTIDPEHST